MARTLTVYLAADTSRFRTGMAQAGNAVDGPQGFGGRVRGLSHTLGNVLGPAMIGAGIAAGAMAVKFGVDGVKAAINEEAEVNKLATALDNLGFADSAAEVEEWISATARASTFSDSDLRPGMALLAGATKSVTEAQRLMAIAMDVSVGAGKPLDQVVKAIARSVDGQTGSLSKLVPGLDKAVLKSGDLNQITDLLSQRFAGQASEAAGTWQGKIGNVTEAFGELQEAFGAGFLGGLDSAETGVSDLTTTLYDMQPTIKEVGAGIGETVVATLELVQGVIDAKKAFESWTETSGPFGDFVGDAVDSLYVFTGGVLALRDAMDAAYEAWNRLQGIQVVNGLTYTGDAPPTLTAPNRPEYDSQVPRAITANQVGNAIYKVLADTDARKGYVVGGVLR